MSEQQAKRLRVQSRTQISEYLEKCCLLVRANNSDQRTAEDLAMLTGIHISHSTQQRLVHRQVFEAIVVDEAVDTISIDGGKARIRTPKGQESAWNDYKAVTGTQAIGGYFKQNPALVNWVNQQPLTQTFSCLGDGHDGIWNLFAEIGDPAQRVEILDWFHLMENLHKMAVPFERERQLKELLWRGNQDEVLQQLSQETAESVLKFVADLDKHRSPIPDYQALQRQGLTIGSGAVESALKQIGRRLKISGAPWRVQHVEQVVKHRCAYLNGYFTSSQFRPAS